jgi:hypothetical protein
VRDGVPLAQNPLSNERDDNRGYQHQGGCQQKNFLADARLSAALESVLDSPPRA